MAKSYSDAVTYGKKLAGTTIVGKPITHGDPVYHIGGSTATHSQIVQASPSNQRADVDKYLTTMRMLKSKAVQQAPNADDDTITNHFTLSNTKNDMGDMVTSIVKTVGKPEGK